MILSQIETVPASVIKDVLLILGALIVVAGIIIGIIVAFRKSSVSIDPQPVEVRKTPKRYNHELAETKHSEVVRRLDGHDKEIQSLGAKINEIENVNLGNLREQLSEAREDLMKSGEDREVRLREQIRVEVGGVHERVNEVLAAVSRLEGKIES